MIANRLFLAPLWVVGVLRGRLAVIFLSAVLAVMYPTFVDRAGLPVAALAVIALSTIATGTMIYIGLPARRRSRQALDGLDRTRSLAALDALRTGQIPADPGVLAAAVRSADALVVPDRRADRDVAAIAVPERGGLDRDVVQAGQNPRTTGATGCPVAGETVPAPVAGEPEAAGVARGVPQKIRGHIAETTQAGNHTAFTIPAHTLSRCDNVTAGPAADRTPAAR